MPISPPADAAGSSSPTKPSHLSLPSLAPLKPTLPRSQAPRPHPQPTPQSHSSPAVSTTGSGTQTRPDMNRPPSAPLFSDHSSAGAMTGMSAEYSLSSHASSSRQPLVTPSSSNAHFSLGAPFTLPSGLVSANSANLSGQSQAQAQAQGQGHPLKKNVPGDSTASSTTSVHGLLSASSGGIAGLPPSSTGPSGLGGLQTPVHQLSSNADRTGATSVGQTPQTGASKMAAAAKRGLDGIPSASAVGLAKMVEEEEGHPLSEKSLRERDYQTIHTLNRLFHLPSRWRLIRPLGQGAYGLVISVQDSYSGEPVAVKCITRVFDKVILARRALREITLLRHFGGHENLTGLIDLDNVWEGYNEIYLYMEPMEADLHQIVRSAQSLSNSHIQYFLYQLLRGMKYIHTANVIHRDLKPGNLLVNSDCELKICDFGLARGFKPVTGEEGQNDDLKLTEYVATRWYRAPEVMLSNRRYTTAIDVWSIGCILAELLGGKPLFKGKDYVDQLNLILGVLGTPDDETLDRVGSEKANAYIRSLPHMEQLEFSALFPDADPDALDLLSQLLAFDPSERIDVIEALSHPYLASYHDPTDEPSCPELFSKWEQVESLTTIEELREAITREIEGFREEVRTVDDEDYLDEEDEQYEEGGEPDAQGGQGQKWRVEGLEEGESIHASPMPDTGMLEGVSIPTQPGVGLGMGTSPRTISPRTNFSPMAKRASLIASTSPEQRKNNLNFGSSSTPMPPNGQLPGQAGSGAGAGSLPMGARSSAMAGMRTRDASPATPATALSEESFGNPFSAPATASASGRASRRQSSHSMSLSMSGRRPNSFLFNPFGAGMTPMPSANPVMGSHPAPPLGDGAAAAGTASPGVGAGGDNNGTPQRGRSGSTHSTWGGRRSRAPSQSGIGLLIRQLSVVDFEGKGDHRPQELQEVPPMTVSPSDAPPSEVPKGFN